MILEKHKAKFDDHDIIVFYLPTKLVDILINIFYNM